MLCHMYKCLQKFLHAVSISCRNTVDLLFSKRNSNSTYFSISCKQRKYISGVFVKNGSHRLRFFCLRKDFLNFFFSHSDHKCIFNRILTLHIKTIQQILELQSLEIDISFLCIKISKLRLFQFISKIRVYIDCRQHLTHLCLIPVFHQIFRCSRRLQFGCMLVGIFNRSVFYNNLGRRLFSDSRHPWDII